jgi:hemerythrin-like metal-binding protein
MALITWSSVLSVGVSEIDDQHKRLVELANQLNDAMRAGLGRDYLGGTLSELVRYTQYHFATEERLMAQHQYPESNAHKTQHTNFVNDVAAFKAKFEKGDTALTSDVMNFLRDWLCNHIMRTDKELGRALNELGIK